MTMDHFRLLDYHAWAPHQDVVSTDHYVVDALEHPRAELSFHGDLTRGLAGGGPWVLMEHSTSAVNWQPVNPVKPPRETLLDSLSHVARGADTLGFFQWRQSRAGSEKYHSALVPHAGADSDRFREVCELGAVAARLGEVVGSRVEADVALLWDYEAAWAVEGPGMPSAQLDYTTAGHTGAPAAARPRHHLRRGAPRDRAVALPRRRRPHAVPRLRRRGAGRGRRGARRCARRRHLLLRHRRPRRPRAARAAIPAPSATCWGCGSRSSPRCAPARPCP